MRKSMLYALVLTALMIGLIFFLSSDYLPNKPGELVDEQEIDESKPADEQEVVTTPDVTEHPETKKLAIEIDGSEEMVELKRYSDETNTFVIYIDEEHFTYEEGLSQTITSKESRLATLTIEGIPDQTPEEVARTRAEQYREDFSVNGPSSITNPVDGLHLKGTSDGEILNVYMTSNPAQDTVFVVTARYPKAAENTIGARIEAMAKTFEMEDTRDVQ